VCLIISSLLVLWILGQSHSFNWLTMSNAYLCLSLNLETCIPWLLPWLFWHFLHCGNLQMRSFV
jgi:hypothetical protein